VVTGHRSWRALLKQKLLLLPRGSKTPHLNKQRSFTVALFMRPFVCALAACAACFLVIALASAAAAFEAAGECAASDGRDCDVLAAGECLCACLLHHISLDVTCLFWLQVEWPLFLLQTAASCALQPLPPFPRPVATLLASF
jgi:hypothetical protein